MINTLTKIGGDYWKEVITIEQVLLINERCGTELVLEDGRITATGIEEA